MSTLTMPGMSNIPLRIIKTIVMNNPIGLFVRMILAKWSLVIVLPAIMVTYWVLLGLHNTGILDRAFTTVSRGLLETKAVAQNCTPKIADLSALWLCLQDPGIYIEHLDEALMRHRIRALEMPSDMSGFLAPDVRDPYSQFYDSD